MDASRAECLGIVSQCGLDKNSFMMRGCLGQNATNVVCFFGSTVVLADVLVNADDVEGMGKGIVEAGGTALNAL
jgi:hypothetical protein